MTRTVALVACLLAGAPAVAAQDPVAEGRSLYARDCISCHGPNGDGVSPAGPDRGAGGQLGAGPSLHDVGPASLDFYLSTGRMPLEQVGEQPERGEPRYTEAQIDALVAYVETFPGEGLPVPEVAPEEGSVSAGLTAYTTFCAGCHQVVGEGGVVTGAVAPALAASTPVEIAEAVRVGPYVMPAFDERVIDERTLNDIVRYLQYARDPRDEGGWGIGHLGPIPEGLVAWLVGGAALLLVVRIVGERLR